MNEIKRTDDCTSNNGTMVNEAAKKAVISEEIKQKYSEFYCLYDAESYMACDFNQDYRFVVDYLEILDADDPDAYDNTQTVKLYYRFTIFNEYAHSFLKVPDFEKYFANVIVDSDYSSVLHRRFQLDMEGNLFFEDEFDDFYNPPKYDGNLKLLEPVPAIHSYRIFVYLGLVEPFDPNNENPMDLYGEDFSDTDND